MARRAGEVRGRSCRRTRLRRPRSWPPFKLTATRCRPTRRPKKRSAALAACWEARPSCAAAATRVRTSARTASAAETELRPEAAASAANRRRPKTFSSEFFSFFIFFFYCPIPLFLLFVPPYRTRLLLFFFWVSNAGRMTTPFPLG